MNFVISQSADLLQFLFSCFPWVSCLALPIFQWSLFLLSQALIESLEGKQGKPRMKPPFPADIGKIILDHSIRDGLIKYSFLSNVLAVDGPGKVMPNLLPAVAGLALWRSCLAR